MKYNDENVSAFLHENRVIRKDDIAKCKDLIQKYLDWEQKQEESLALADIRGSLSIEEVAARFGQEVTCMFYDYDDRWKERTMTVDVGFLRDMQQGAIKNCH